MSQLPLFPAPERKLLVHHYIRRFGRRPTDADLRRYQHRQAAPSGRLVGWSARVRRRAATVITRC